MLIVDGSAWSGGVVQNDGELVSMEQWGGSMSIKGPFGGATARVGAGCGVRCAALVLPDGSLA